MKIDLVENLENYKIVTQEMVDFVKYAMNNPMEEKEYELKNGAYAIYQVYNTKENADLEAHRKFIDIQIILKGKEKIEVTKIDGLKVKTPYVYDVVFFEDPEEVTTLEMIKETFTIFYPKDAHKPCIQFDGIEEVIKIVIKVPIY